MSSEADAPMRWIKPVVARLRKPDGALLAEEGEPVAWDNYWQRRLNDGDVAPMTAAEIRAFKKAARADGDTK